jgi:cell division protein FtsQ
MSRWNLKSGIRNGLLLLAVVITLSFVTSQADSEEQRGIVLVNIDNSGNRFVNEDQVRELMIKVAAQSMDSTTGLVNLRKLEEELMTFSFMKEAQASWDLKGNLVIDIVQDEPIARIMSSAGKGAYISRERNLLPLSDKYTAHVIIITGAGADSLLSETFLHSPKGARVCELIDYISDSEFLSHQIAQLDINQWMNISLYPQIGKQYFEFGKPIDFEEKFRKMDIFYKQIIPKRGWDAYKVVKLQYKDQIVCR